MPPQMPPMEPIVLITHKWGSSFHIPWYLFLGGMAGGTLVIAALADLFGAKHERYQALSRIAAYITLPIIIVGGLVLTFHLGKPERGILFPLFMSNYRSWLTIGGWIIGAFFPLALAYAALWYFRMGRAPRLIVALLSIPAGIGIALYTGLLISGTWSIPGGYWFSPLWDSRYIPVLFLISGLSTGLAACGLVALAVDHFRPSGVVSRELGGAGETAGTLSLLDTLVIVAEASWVYLMFAAFVAGDVGQRLVFGVLTKGDLAPWFWGGIALALALPFLASLVKVLLVKVIRVPADWLLYVKFVMVLAGGLLLRYVIIWGGEIRKPLPFPPFNVY